MWMNVYIYICEWVHVCIYIYMDIYIYMEIYIFSIIINYIYSILCIFVIVVALSCPILCNPLDCMQHTKLFCLSPSPRACSNSCPSSQWRHPIISSSVNPFSTCLQFFPVSGSFLMSQLFASGGQSIGASAPASVLPMNTQNWFPLGFNGLISLQSQRLSRSLLQPQFKNQFFSAQPSLWSNSHIHTW